MVNTKAMQVPEETTEENLRDPRVGKYFLDGTERE